MELAKSEKSGIMTSEFTNIQNSQGSLYFVVLHTFIAYVVLTLRCNVQVFENTRIKLFSLEIRRCYNTCDERWNEDDQYSVTV